jgi:predicted outer membrane protein
VAVLLAAALVACGRQAPEPQPVPLSVPPPAAAPASGFGPTERAFVELSIATGDAAIRLLDLGARRAGDPALGELARDLGRAHRAELAELHGLLADEAVAYVNHHAGHDMPGMPTDAELATLAGSGAGFDAEFARLLRAHLDESAGVVRSALGSLGHEPTRAAAERMERDRAAALTRLDR